MDWWSDCLEGYAERAFRIEEYIRYLRATHKTVLSDFSNKRTELELEDLTFEEISLINKSL